MDTKDEAIRQIEKECFDIMYRKNQDYGDNISRHGEEGVIIRLWDKLYRLDNVFHSGNREVVDETLEDTIKDARNYLTILLLLLRNEWELPWKKREHQFDYPPDLKQEFYEMYPEAYGGSHCPPHEWIKGTQGGPWVCKICGFYKDGESISRWKNIKRRNEERGPSTIIKTPSLPPLPPEACITGTKQEIQDWTQSKGWNMCWGNEEGPCEVT